MKLLHHPAVQTLHDVYLRNRTLDRKTQVCVFAKRQDNIVTESHLTPIQKCETRRSCSDVANLSKSQKSII